MVRRVIVINSILSLHLRRLWLRLTRRWTKSPTHDTADHPDGESAPTNSRADDIEPTQRNQNCAYHPQPPRNLVSFHTRAKWPPCYSASNLRDSTFRCPEAL